jgi:hypothetical protein
MQETTADKTSDDAMFDKDIRGYDSLGELADLLEVSIENIKSAPFLEHTLHTEPRLTTLHPRVWTTSSSVRK